MPEKVIRFMDYERRSKEPDAAASARYPMGATIIILPVVRIERCDDPRGEWPVPRSFA